MEQSKLKSIKNNKNDNISQDLSQTKENMNIEDTRPEEHGGPKYPEPTRYGDWERNGRVSDF